MEVIIPDDVLRWVVVMSKYFKPEEFESKDGRKSPYPLVVQPYLYTLLDEIREAFGGPLYVTSGYRSPEHNKTVGGVENSYHVLGMAADIKPKRQKDVHRLYKICDELNPNGGVGKYHTFVHVDIRPVRARWEG